MKISQSLLIFFTSLFLVLFTNVIFFKEVLKIYPFEQNVGFVISIAFVLLFFISLLFTIFSSKWTTKPILILILLISSIVSYFAQTYNIIIDSTMIQNILQTNFDESLDLISFALLGYFVVLGVIPALFVYKADIQYGTFLQEQKLKIKLILLYIVLIAILLFGFSKHYTSFFREHKPLRFYTNPTYYIYSIGKYISQTYSTEKMELKVIGSDAILKKGDRKKVVFMVVGEAVRSDRFGLNSYKNNTTPLLEKRDIISFSNFYSCGTTTAISVPCMFSIYSHDEYSYKKGLYTQNVIDVLAHTNGIELLWRDNNSDSKGVVTRIKYEDYRSSKLNTICDDECRDEGMLVGLDEFIANSGKKDVFIVLHQMGNHGPAYFKRYPKEFEKYTPVCKINQLEECSV